MTEVEVLNVEASRLLSDVKPLQRQNDVQVLEQQSSPLYVDNHLNFADRLSTFKLSWWSCKPSAWSPWRCSRYGWICIEKDLLRCSKCRKFLSSHSPPSGNLVVYEKCCDRFLSQLMESHLDTCPFKSEPTPLDKCTPCIKDRKVALASFSDRYRSFLNASQEIDDTVVFDEESLEIVKDDEYKKLADLVENSNVSSKRIILALCGWHLSSIIDRSELLINCDQCNRKVGLWLFKKPNESIENTKTDPDPISLPLAKRQKFDVDVQNRKFNSINQHCSWCPWLQNVDNLISVLGNENSASEDEQKLKIPCFKALLAILIDFDRSENTSGDILQQFVLAKSLLRSTSQKQLNESNRLILDEEQDENLSKKD